MIDMMKSFIEQAVAREENINSDGSINWNYVDSDVYMEMYNNKVACSQKEYYETFDYLVSRR